MMRRAAFATVFLGIGLGCGGLAQDVRQGAERSFDQQFRKTFVGACVAQSLGPVDPGLQRQVCGCVADELVHTKTPTELADLITSPTLPEIQPVIETCTRKLAR
jgi:hypothetical protein